MSVTYSISQGVTYAELFPNFQSILNVLPDNTQKLIAPRDVRDSFFTTWENIVFKKTTTSTSDEQYIGIDQIDLTQKVFFGKKRLSGIDIMNTELLSSDVDFFFYNTKTEPQSDYSTKLAFLAGTGSFYDLDNVKSPYIESKVVQGINGSYLNFEIRNTSYLIEESQIVGGDINILSDRGFVSLNGVILPKYSENLTEDNDGKYLKFVWAGTSAYATWSTVEIPDQPDPVDPDTIFFTDSTPTPQALGGIPQNSTFDNVPVTEMFRRLLYPYLKPIVSTSFAYSIIESGDTSTANLQSFNYQVRRPGTYSITGRTLEPSTLKSTSPPLFNPSDVNPILNGSVQPEFNVFLPTSQNVAGVSVKLTVTDANSSSVDSTSSFNIVLPWYSGVSTTATNTVSGINNILGTSSLSTNKLIPTLRASAGTIALTLTTIGLGGQGCIYFGYPSSYGDITSIKDQNNFDVTGDFQKFTLTGINSPLGRWGGSENRTYKFYIYTQGTGTPKTTLLNGQFRYQFNF